MADDERHIRDLIDAWMAASKAGDVSALLGLMTEDVVFMTPGRPPFGKAGFTATSKSMSGLAMDGQSEIQEIEVFGDYAYVRNHIRVTLTRPGEAPKRLSGFAMSILRKEADGQWRIARDANLVMPEA
jgi:uncharacterized protein (TIGR02246 family)